MGSGGAAYSNEELLEFASGATALTSKELYFTYPKDMNNGGYYYSGDGMYNFTFNYGEFAIIRSRVGFNSKDKIKKKKREKNFSLNYCCGYRKRI